MKTATISAATKRPFPHFKFPYEINVEIKRIPEDDCSWYGVPVGSYFCETKNYGWFPTELIAEVINDKFTQGVGLSLKTGYKRANNTGTACVIITNVKETANILSNAGYNVTVW